MHPLMAEKGILGRGDFLAALAGCVQEAEAGDKSGLLMLKVRNLRQINHHYGHAVGDDLLRQIGGRLCEATRELDLVGRIGSAEFGILLPRLRVEGQAILAASKLTRVFHEAIVCGDLHKIRAEIAIGVLVVPDQAETLDTALLNCDQALQAAIRYSEPFRLFSGAEDQEIVQTLNIEREFVEALDNDELEVAYQPKVDLVTGNLVGLEVLTRWRHPSRGLLTADRFVPYLQDIDLLQSFHWWVLRTALRHSGDRPEPWDKLPVAVNLPLEILEDEEFAELMEETLGLWGLTPHRLTLELKESRRPLLLDKVVANMEKLQILGVRLAVDNFGAGQDALALVRLFAIDQIKIPRALVKSLTGKGRDDAIVQTIINLAHKMNISVGAGGIENTDALEVLTGLGCDYGQGYAIAGPMPQADLLHWLQARQD